MVLLDDARRHVEVNGAYLALLGYRRARLIGRPVYELLAEGPLASTREWRTLLRRRQFTGAADLVCADGRRVRVEFAGHPESVIGQQLVLFVARRTAPAGRRRVVGLVERLRPTPFCSTSTCPMETASRSRPALATVTPKSRCC